ncbi:NAD-dependent epimerase/dehydratase family protein [Actinomadura kijaniata]|uniref:NAD-dependent epimerase/dehydratase family protein n=1 Tax=Actinomadura kijaniata TaxID=46161 RepID=UPI003F1B689F
MNDRRPTLLITGGSGVLGRHLLRRATEHRYRVVALDTRPPASRSDLVEAHVGDIRDDGLVDRLTRGATAVVHCAAALPSHRPEEIWSVDVDGTRTLLAAAARNGVERFVHVSSTAVYGLPRLRPTPEDHPLEAVDPYNRAKIAAEEVCARFRARGMCVPVLRPKTFLGPGRLGIFAMLFEWAGEGRDFPLPGGGRVRCQMLDVDDLCDVVLRVLDLPAAEVDDVFNVAAASFGTLREDFQAVLDAAGKGGRVVSVPARPAEAVLRVLARMKVSPVYGRLARKLLEDSYVSIEKAQDRLGFRPRYSNTESLLRTYEWYRADVRAGSGHRTGQTHAQPWRQGALRLAKAIF